MKACYFFCESPEIRIGNYFVTIFLTIQVVRFKPALARLTLSRKATPDYLKVSLLNPTS